MIRIAANMLVVLVATASFAFAQVAASIQDQMNAQLSAQGIDPATATAEQQEAALGTVLNAAIAAELDGDVAGASDDEIAAAVNAIVARNPTLADNTVGALAAAAAGLRPSAAAAIAGQAAAARPSAAGAVTYNVGMAVTTGLGPSATQSALGNIAVAVVNAVYSAGDDTAVVGEIAAAASVAYSERRGRPTFPGDVFGALGRATGLNPWSQITALANAALGGADNADAALMDGAVFETRFSNLGSEFLDADTQFFEENPAQDASPS